jgi:hypothetical protein
LRECERRGTSRTNEQRNPARIGFGLYSTLRIPARTSHESIHLLCYLAYPKYSRMETSVYRVHHTSPQAPQFIANVAIPGGSPITPECITRAIQGLTLSSPSEQYSGFINYQTSGPAAIHIRHSDNSQKRLVSTNATDLLLQIIMTRMSTEFETSRGRCLVREYRKIPEEFPGLCGGAEKREGRGETMA